jgi:hypothetical protein
MSNRQHWHCLAFLTSIDNGWAAGHVYIGRQTRNITKSDIDEVLHGMDPMFAKATLLSASYLGEMTPDEFGLER